MSENQLCPQVVPLGDSAVLAVLGKEMDPEVNGRVLALWRWLDRTPFPGYLESAPAYASVTVYFDPVRAAAASPSEWNMPDGLPGARLPEPSGGFYERLIAWIRIGAASPVTVREAAPPVPIPVCYGGESGPDLEELAAWSGLSPLQVIELHCREVYRVYMMGFLPGFPYLGMVPGSIAMPRRATPRVRVPAGSVGIAGRQTGIYPLESPGGWQLIGRTPFPLLRRTGGSLCALQPGDRVRFEPVPAGEYERLIRECL